MKRSIKTILTSVLLLSISSLVFSDAVIEDPLERKVLDIASKLRCTVCQNQPVAESNSGLAKDMRAVIKEKLQQGKKEKEIIQFFVDRYGDYVLLAPPKKGSGLPIWLLPPIFLLGALLFAIVVMKSGREKKITTLEPLSEKDQERIRYARKAMDESGEDK